MMGQFSGVARTQISKNPKLYCCWSKGSKSKPYPQLTESRLGMLEVLLKPTFPELTFGKFSFMVTLCLVVPPYGIEYFAFWFLFFWPSGFGLNALPLLKSCNVGKKIWRNYLGQKFQYSARFGLPCSSSSLTSSGIISF